MDRQLTETLRRLQAPLYFIGALMIAVPAVDFLANVWPLRPRNLEWRYGTTGLLSGFTFTPLFGAVLLTGLAGLLQHRRTLRAAGITAGVLALLLALATGLFVLDVVQFRRAVPVEALRTFDVGSWKSVFKHLTVIVALAWLGHACWRAGRPARR